MIKLILILTICFAIFAENTKWGVESDDGVSVLTDNNFETFITNNKLVFVKFYGPDCIHCKKMAAGYAKMARKLDTSDKLPVAITHIDAPSSPETAAKYEVSGYPTLKLFYRGIAIDYDGERNERTIAKWIAKRSTDKITEITTLDGIKEIQKSKLAVLLVLSHKSTKSVNNLSALSLSFDKIQFAYTYLDEAIKYLNLEPQTSLIVIRNFDEGHKTLTTEDEIPYSTMKKFFDSVRKPVVAEFNDETAKEIFGEKKTAVFFFTEEENNEKLEIFNKLAKSKKFDLTFCKSGIKGGISAKLAEFIGIHERNLNQVRIVKFVGNDVVKFKLEDVTEDSLKKFLEDFVNEKLAKYLKSDAPVNNDNENVKTVVGENYEKMVLDNDNYVLLEAHAPWCGHCKELEPVYQKLAERVKGMKHMVIAKIDATANEHPSLSVKGFPTIRLYKKGSKSSPVDFHGDRTLKGFLAFLKEELGSDWKEPDVAVEESL